ncbi:MAG: calcium-binding protein [Pseudomonadota bacterium]
MKRLTFAGAVAICAVTLVAGAVFAQPNKDRAPVTFEELDANNDGQVTRAEIDTHRADRIARADTDGDGSVSLEELQRRADERSKARAERLMERLDTDKNGVLSSDELTGGDRAGRMFERLDKDDSGSISAEEFAQARKGAQKRRTIVE